MTTRQAPARLRSFVQRIEHLEEEIRVLNDDKSEVYKEAKGEGFDVKALRAVIQRRRRDQRELFEFDEMVDLYEREIAGGADVATRALEAFGEPVELTDEEKAKGYTAAFIDEKGTRVALGLKTAAG